jgi:hypothetical protein
MEIEERYLDFGFEKTPVYLNSPVRFVVEEPAALTWGSAADLAKTVR